MSTKFQVKKATKKQVKARIAIAGPSGSGKTYTGLVAATALANGRQIAVIDTERGSASLYSDYFDFDVLELEPPFSPQVYKQAIKAAEDAGYGVIIIDSLSHAWEGEGGALDLADEATARQRTPNSYTAWREVTPLHREMVDAILQSKAHVVATMRSKTEYAIENTDGKTNIRKVGMAPIQRAGMEYEFTVVGDMDLDHKIVISKSRFAPLQDKVATKPTTDFFMPFVEWLDSGVDSKPIPAKAPQPDPLEDYLVDELVTKPQAKAKAKQTDGAIELPVLTIEDAYSVTNSQGLKYGETSVKVLEKMLSAMWAQVHNNGLDPDEKAVVLRKISAAKTVMEAKQDGSIQ